ncbi:MAG: hypothetical protein ACE3L7_12985 [Candidatus Pristimantibacillus sp.]
MKRCFLLIGIDGVEGTRDWCLALTVDSLIAGAGGCAWLVVRWLVVVLGWWFDGWWLCLVGGSMAGGCAWLVG